MADKNGNGSHLKGMTPEAIQALLSKSRNRGIYGIRIVEFADDSDEAAVNVRDAWPVDFKGKQATALYQGFLGSLKKAKLEDTIQVKQSEGEVYLLHTERVALMQEAMTAS